MAFVWSMKRKYKKSFDYGVVVVRRMYIVTISIWDADALKAPIKATFVFVTYLSSVPLIQRSLRGALLRVLWLADVSEPGQGTEILCNVLANRTLLTRRR